MKPRQSAGGRAKLLSVPCIRFTSIILIQEEGRTFDVNNENALNTSVKFKFGSLSLQTVDLLLVHSAFSVFLF